MHNTHIRSNIVPTFSSLSSMTGGSTGFGREGGLGEEEDGKVGGGEGSGGTRRGNGEEENKAAGSSVPVLLPEVRKVTGEEGEKKIVHVSIRSMHVTIAC